jgi:hypothetical protein
MYIGAIPSKSACLTRLRYDSFTLGCAVIHLAYRELSSMCPTMGWDLFTLQYARMPVFYYGLG